MRIRRGELHDLYVEDGRAAVMAKEQVLVLSELATVILLAVPHGMAVELDDIVEAVVTAFGPPEPPQDAVVLTQEYVHDLVAYGVLVMDASRSGALSASSMAAATLALHSALATVLDPESRWVLPDEVSPEAFLAAVRRQRVGGQIVTGLERLDLPGQVRAQLQADSDGMRASCSGLARDLHRVLDVLDEAGVRALTFKGLALAAQAWGDEGARGYGDLDLLVPTADLDTTLRALTRDGWHHPAEYPLPGPTWGWRQFVRTSHEMPLTLGATPLDLHWAVLPARSAFPDFDTLWQRRATVVVMGRAIPTLAPYDALAHSASHSAKDHWRWLRGLADVHRLMAAPETWRTADRPLRHDQLLSIGIAARLFGMPQGAPDVVRDAVRVSAHAEESSLLGQLGPEHALLAQEHHRATLVLRSYLAHWRTRSGPRDILRHVALTALPTRFLAEEPSANAYVAASRALWHRGTEIAQRVATGGHGAVESGFRQEVT